MTRSGGRSLGMGITLSWIADWGWGIGLYVESSGPAWELLGGGTQSTTQRTSAGHCQTLSPMMQVSGSQVSTLALDDYMRCRFSEST